MKLAVAHRHGSPLPTDLPRAEMLSVYERRLGRFEIIEERPIPDAMTEPRAAWVELLHDCQGIVVRSIPPRISLELQRNDIFPLSGAGFGPDGLDEALDFLAACLGFRVKSAA